MTSGGRGVGVVCFDCDSTLSRIEGIDELARRAGVEEDVAPLTTAAMTGELTLDAVYARRLELVCPDSASIAWLGRLYVEEMVPGAREAVQAIVKSGKEVHIVSGGLRQAIFPIARALGIPESHVHAVDVVHTDDGSYNDFDRESPLVRPEGKAEVCGALMASGGSVALVGDGATDIAAREAGVYVVGFGGVAVRQNVVDNADVFVPGPELTAVLEPLMALESASS